MQQLKILGHFYGKMSEDKKIEIIDEFSIFCVKCVGSGESPVVQVGCVAHLGAQALQQHPGGAALHRFGPLRREDEPDGPAVGEAHVAVRPIRGVLHQPLRVHHGEVMDVKDAACQGGFTVN